MKTYYAATDVGMLGKQVCAPCLCTLSTSMPFLMGRRLYQNALIEQFYKSAPNLHKYNALL